MFVLAGTLAEIPLPDDSVDVILTQRAIGWDFAAENEEICRVVRTGGIALHLLGAPYPAEDEAPYHRELSALGYIQGSYQDGTSVSRKYFKHI